MAERLKSISKRIHWSSLLKAGIFALAWWILPYWLFLLVALYLYFAHLFQAGKLGVPFLILLILCWLQPAGLVFAIIFGGLFYAIILIKELLVIDRRSAYELLALVLSFLMLRSLYLRFNEGVTGWALFSSFVAAAALALLLNSLVTCFEGELTVDRSIKRITVWMAFLLFSQVLIAGLFLPLDFIYQSIVAFLAAILVFDLVPDYLFGTVSPGKIFTAGATTFALYAIVLSSARWGL